MKELCEIKGCKNHWKGAMIKGKKVCNRHFKLEKNPTKPVADYYLGKMKSKRA